MPVTRRPLAVIVAGKTRRWLGCGSRRISSLRSSASITSIIDRGVMYARRASWALERPSPCAEHAQRRVLQRREAVRAHPLVDSGANGPLEARNDVADARLDGLGERTRGGVDRVRHERRSSHNSLASVCNLSVTLGARSLAYGRGQLQR